MTVLFVDLLVVYNILLLAFAYASITLYHERVLAAVRAFR